MAKTVEKEGPIGYGEAEERLVLFLPKKMKAFLRLETNRRKVAGDSRVNMNVLIREAIAEKYPKSVA